MTESIQSDKYKHVIQNPMARPNRVGKTRMSEKSSATNNLLGRLSSEQPWINNLGSKVSTGVRKEIYTSDHRNTVQHGNMAG